MKASHIALCLIGVLGIVAIPAAAQTLGDRMEQEGTAWIIGAWALSSSPPAMNVNRIEYEWDLDRHVALMSMERQRDKYKYRGMILFVPSKKEIVGIGADSMGSTYKVSCRSKDSTLVHGLERTRADGGIDRIDMVCTKVDNDTMKIDMLLILEEGGQRSSQPLTAGTYRREKASTKEE